MLIFATRPSTLARWQTSWVREALLAKHPSLICEEKVITTQGDRILDRPLPEIGGKGLFTRELEAELLSGAVHAAVHSLKDLPVENPPGLTIGCIPKRADVGDVLLSNKGQTLHELPPGAVVGTSSLRRSAQLLAVRPDLRIAPLRGNVDTRIRKLKAGQYDAIVLAGAGVIRLGLSSEITEWLSLDWMLPAPGQGALAVQCRADDKQTLEILSAIENPQSRSATLAERSFLQALGGGCSVPVAAYAEQREDKIHLTGAVISLDGKQVIRCQASGQNAHQVGQECAQIALSSGAAEILSSVLAEYTENRHAA
jgi:hydroxymethylbilane synthase